MESIKLSSVVIEENGNTFLADLTIEMSELRKALAKEGFKIIKK